MQLSLIAVCLLAVIPLVISDPSAHPHARPHPHPLPDPEANPDPSVIHSMVSRIPFLSESTKKAISLIPATLWNKIPNLQQLLTMTKQAFAGLPFKLASNFLQDLCSTGLAQNVMNPTFLADAKDMNYYIMTGSSNVSIPILNTAAVVNHTDFDLNKVTVIFVTGWNSNIDNKNDALYMLYQAFMCNGSFNFMTIDTAKFVDTLYIWSSFNTEDVGREIGRSIISLKHEHNVQRIHLVGHSLGAHIIGSAAREYYKNTTEKLYRATGLDPARPCFLEGEGLLPLQKGDARFVDIIHSNPGILGKIESMGDADFYPNGHEPLPPGCLGAVCAHHRAVRWFAETVLPGYGNNFMATRCSSIGAYRQGKCTEQAVPMGMDCPADVKGNYYLETRGHSPYGKHAPRDTRPRCVDNTNFNVDINNEDYIDPDHSPGFFGLFG